MFCLFFCFCRGFSSLLEVPFSADDPNRLQILRMSVCVGDDNDRMWHGAVSTWHKISMNTPSNTCPNSTVQLYCNRSTKWNKVSMQRFHDFVVPCTNVLPPQLKKMPFIVVVVRRTKITWVTVRQSMNNVYSHERFLTSFTVNNAVQETNCSMFIFHRNHSWMTSSLSFLLVVLSRPCTHVHHITHTCTDTTLYQSLDNRDEEAMMHGSGLQTATTTRWNGEPSSAHHSLIISAASSWEREWVWRTCFCVSFFVRVLSLPMSVCCNSRPLISLCVVVPVRLLASRAWHNGDAGSTTMIDNDKSCIDKWCCCVVSRLFGQDGR